jgi:hypothetical protein
MIIASMHLSQACVSPGLPGGFASAPFVLSAGGLQSEGAGSGAAAEGHHETEKSTISLEEM